MASVNIICPITLGPVGSRPFVFQNTETKSTAYNYEAFARFLKKLDFRDPITRRSISSKDVQEWCPRTHLAITREIETIYVDDILGVCRASRTDWLGEHSRQIRQGEEAFKNLTHLALYSGLVHVYICRKAKWRSLKRELLSRTKEEDFADVHWLLFVTEETFKYAMLTYEYEGCSIFPILSVIKPIE